MRVCILGHLIYASWLQKKLGCIDERTYLAAPVIRGSSPGQVNFFTLTNKNKNEGPKGEGRRIEDGGTSKANKRTFLQVDPLLLRTDMSNPDNDAGVPSGLDDDAQMERTPFPPLRCRMPLISYASSHLRRTAT